jgi:hypothetical protein
VKQEICLDRRAVRPEADIVAADLGETSRATQHLELKPLHIDLEERRPARSPTERKPDSGPTSTSVTPTSFVPGNNSDCRAEIGNNDELSADALTCMVAVPASVEIAASNNVTFQSFANTRRYRAAASGSGSNA